MTSPQPPQKDFLALTHGQEWVTFYESFDLLVQDHLSRSSDLLRRAMSLPEVADREVAQVRDDLEGKLAAERERASVVLTDVKTQIVNSHRLASTLAMSIGSLMTDLHSLNMRVDEAIQASSQASQAAVSPASSSPVAPTGLLRSTPTGAPSMTASPAAPGAGSLPGTNSLSSAQGGDVDDQASSDEIESFGEASTEADALGSDAAADLVEEPVMDVAGLADAVDAGDEVPIDLTAIAEAEESSPDASDTGLDATQDGIADASSESGERQRPHWLSVTRVGASRP